MFTSKKPYEEIDVVELGRTKMRRIDVRTQEEFHGDLGHLEDAELVPLNQLVATAQVWSRDEPLLMICRSGNRSGQACQVLHRMGFTNVTNLRGGMVAVRSQARVAS